MVKTTQRHEQQQSLPARMPIGQGVTLIEMTDDKAILEIVLGGNLGISSTGKSKGVLLRTDLKLRLNRRNSDYLAQARTPRPLKRTATQK